MPVSRVALIYHLHSAIIVIILLANGLVSSRLECEQSSTSSAESGARSMYILSRSKNVSRIFHRARLGWGSLKHAFPLLFVSYSVAFLSFHASLLFGHFFRSIFLAFFLSVCVYVWHRFLLSFLIRFPYFIFALFFFSFRPCVRGLVRRCWLCFSSLIAPYHGNSRIVLREYLLYGTTFSVLPLLTLLPLFSRR